MSDGASERERETTERVQLSDLDGAGRTPLFEREPKTVRLALAAGGRVPPHRHPGRDIVCHVLEGRIGMELDDDVHELSAGDVVRFDGDRDISPVAREDSEALLVLAQR